MCPWLEVWGVVADLLDLLWYWFCLVQLNLAVLHWPLLICLWIHSFEIQHLSFDDIMISSYQWIVFLIINVDFWAWFPVRRGNRSKPLHFLGGGFIYRLESDYCSKKSLNLYFETHSYWKRQWFAVWEREEEKYWCYICLVKTNRAPLSNSWVGPTHPVFRWKLKGLIVF